MDLKTIKQNIAVNRVILNRTIEQNIDADMILPDYYLPISKILKCKATPRVSSVGINGQTLSLDGDVTVCVIYVSSENTVCGFEQSIPFSRSFEIEEDAEGSVGDCIVKCEYINCRAINERKLDVRGAVAIEAKVIKKDSKQALTDLEGGNIVLKRCFAPATTPVSSAEKSLLIEEDMELGNGQPMIANIIRYDAKAVNKECRIISGKVVVKGEMNVSVLYSAEGVLKPQIFNGTIPYSQIIDIENVGENCECACRVCVAQLEVKPRTSATGESKKISLFAKLRFNASVSCENDLQVITDAYSTKYEADIIRTDIEFEKLKNNVSDSLIIKKKIEIGVSDIVAVNDIWCDSDIAFSKLQDGELIIGGNVGISMLLSNADEAPIYKETQTDFEYRCKADGLGERIRCDCFSAVTKISYNISNSSCVEVTLQLSVSADVYNISKIPVITEITVDKDKTKESLTDNALMIYFADSGEKIWDIARKYNSSPEEICEINSIEGEKLLAGKTLLIPIK